MQCGHQVFEKIITLFSEIRLYISSLAAVLLLFIPFFKMLRLITGIVLYCEEGGTLFRLGSSKFFMPVVERPPPVWLSARLIGSILNVGTGS